MENKYVGYILLGVAILIVVVILLFNTALKEIVKSNCTGEHALSCPMYKTINEQTYLALAIVGILVIISLVLIFSKPKDKIIIKKIKEKRQKKIIDLSVLKQEERQVLKMVQENKAIFQADLIDKTGFGKAKITRILDRLEGQNIVERKRRGMNNIVVFKEN